MLAILSFILGASIGSFVQVIAGRLNVAPIIKGRSKCLSCGEALRPLDLVPVFSYIFLKGKCRYCRTKFGIEALLIELFFGLTFLALYFTVLTGQSSLLVSGSWLVYYSLLFGSLGVMALYDRLHSYVPTSFLSIYIVLTAWMYILRASSDPQLLTILSPLFVALPFLIIWLATKGRGLGFGDVILFFGVGAFFGSLQGFAVFILSIWLGAIIGVYLKYIKKSRSHVPTAIPFVPFIVVAFVVVLFTGIDIFSITKLFS